MHLEYPGKCKRCGRNWGDHLTVIALEKNHHACPFVPIDGEIEKPTLISEGRLILLDVIFDTEKVRRK